MAILESSNPRLNEAFPWAEKMARSYVTTGKRGPLNDGRSGENDYIPSYWAGYRTRTAFYIRDYVHQAMGAYYLGLHEENYRMLEAYAESATEEHGLYAVWALNFDGSIYDLDYNSADNFVRETPAQFELVELAWRLYCRTGDKRYLSDKIFDFCYRSMTDFVTMRDSNGNGIPEGKGGDIYEETCTYNEGPKYSAMEAGDGIACQYRAMEALAGIMRARGDEKGADEWDKKAEDLRRYFNEDWSLMPGDEDGIYATALLMDGVTKNNDFALETSWFMPLKGLPYPGNRCEKFLDLITEKLGHGIGFPTAAINIEAYTYLPEVYFRYDRVEDGWKWMKYLEDMRDVHHVGPSQGNNGYYPEVSFTMISHIADGLMGIVQNKPCGTVATFSRLPAEVEKLSLREQELVGCTVSVTHTGRFKTEFENHRGETVLWQAEFAGKHDTITVNGEKMSAENFTRSGVDISRVTLSVPAGVRLCASV